MIDEHEQQERTGLGRRRYDTLGSKIRNITTYITFIVGIIALSEILIRGLNAVIVVGQKAAQLSVIVDQFQPTVIELKSEVAALRTQDSAAIFVIRAGEIRDSSQLVELKRTVTAVNNLARTIKNRQ